MVRKDVTQGSLPLRTEPHDAVLLLMAPPAPCGSFFVYGGWVGGPGQEDDVRLVRNMGLGGGGGSRFDANFFYRRDN